jgi:hypothetical protein
MDELKELPKSKTLYCVRCKAPLTRTTVEWNGEHVVGYLCPNGRLLAGPSPTRCGFALGYLKGGKSGKGLA